MKISQFYSIILHLIALLLLFQSVNCSTSCSIFLSLNCSCFQSDIDLNSTLPMKTYSHLYCQGNSLNEKTFESPFGLDFKSQNRVRTISIEFSIENRIEIQPNQFDSLSTLFSETNKNAQIEISIRFNGFTHITFNKQSLTSKMFDNKHSNKHLWLHFLPSTINSAQIESGEKNSTKIEDQFKFSENSFSGLALSQLNIYIHTIRDRFPTSFPFEFIFNNTNIGELHFHGSIIPPGSSSSRPTFKGVVRSLTLHRHVDTIDSNTFPYYFSVYSYTIHSIEAHSMDLDSFIPEHKNLRGLKLIKPRFEVAIDRFIPTLDSLTLDIEYLDDRTLYAARHIYYLKLGSSLRRINPHVFYVLPNRLQTFDFYDISLSQMTSESRCQLIHYILYSYQDQLNIIYPRIENGTECDCARLLLNDIQSIQKLRNKKDLLCSKQCHFSDCGTISEYFRKKYPIVPNRNQGTIVSNKTNDQFIPSVDLFDDPMDLDMTSFLISQTNNEQKTTRRRFKTTTTFNNFFNIEEDSDVVLLSTPKYSDSSDELTEDDLSQPKRKTFFSWRSILIGVVIVFIFIAIIVSIVVLTVRYRKRKHFTRVPAYV